MRSNSYGGDGMPIVCKNHGDNGKVKSEFLKVQIIVGIPQVIIN